MLRTRSWSLPGRWLILSVIYALGLIATVFLLATEHPWLGLRWDYSASAGGALVRKSEGPAAHIPRGTVLTAIADARGGRVDFEAPDFAPEVDGVLPTYADYEHFLERQGRLTAILGSGEVRLIGAGGESWAVSPRHSRPVSSLPVEFWVQLFVGVVAWLISSGVWAFRRDQASARYLLLSGWCTALFSPLAGIYSTRELALPPVLFRWISDLNFMGGSLFAGALVALLCCYPRRIGPRWLAPAAVAAQGLWFVVQELGLIESMVLARRLLVMVALLATFVLAALQWRGTRRDPIGRAALRWFLLSWLLGSGIFILLILMPQLFGIDTSAMQGYAFSLFILVYVGLAFGILRFGFFELDEWWARTVTWLGVLLVLVVLDLIFLLWLNLSESASMALSLLACGVLWLPLRGFVLSRFLGRRPPDNTGLFKRVVDVALAPNPLKQRERWEHCLSECFDPLRIGECIPPRGLQSPAVTADGLDLVFPAVDALPELRLEYARGGRALFNTQDLETAHGLIAMVRHTLESRSAYEQGVQVERQRIARDIHDNIGAQLLSALQSREADRRERVLREALVDLRGILNDVANPTLSTEESLSDLRYETSERLAAGKITLDWQIQSDPGAGRLPTKLIYALRPLIREAVSNILKHAGAQRVRIHWRHDRTRLEVAVADDGCGFDAGAIQPGRGLNSMCERVRALGGTFTHSSDPEKNGTLLTIRLPLFCKESA